jgi:hypothetical protein
MAISSITSRLAASSTDSPRSTNPPGMDHFPTFGAKPRRKSHTRPSGVCGIAHATGFGL